MAKREQKLPQNVRLLQARFSAAQREFDRQFQAQLSEYTTETIPEFEEQIAGFEQRANDYLNRTNQYSDYVSSFFIKPGTNNVEQFVKYGNNYYWAEDVPGGFNLKAVEGLPALTGGDYQFVKTSERKHAYSYQSYEMVAKNKWVTESYTAYEMQLKPVTKYESVYVPPPLFAPAGTMGRFEYRMVTKNEFVSTPVTKSRQVMKTVFEYDFVPRTAVENIDVGYLKTALPEGGFTQLAPEQFPIRSMPGAFTEAPPEAPPGMDISGIKQQLESEKAYYQRETGELSASTREARMRRRVRPLLSQGEAA